MPYPRPSTLGRLALCPASYMLTLQVWGDELPAKSETSSGARIHKALKDLDFAALDEEEQELAHLCEIYESEILERAGCTRAFQQGLQVVTGREVALELRDGDGILLSGTADSFTEAALPDGWHGIVIDHKTGWKVNLTSISCQLGAYAAMALQTHPDMIDVTAYAYFPRLRHDWVRTFKREDLSSLIFSIKAMITEATEASAEIVFRPSEEACEHCPALGSCAAARQGIFDMERALARLDLSTMESGKLGQLYDRLHVLEDLKALVRDELLGRLKTGDAATGYRLQERQGNRTIPDPEVAWDRIGDLMTPGDFLRCCDLKISRLEKKLPYEIKRRTGCTVAEGKSKMTEILGDACVRKPSYSVIVKQIPKPGVSSIPDIIDLSLTSTEGD